MTLRDAVGSLFLTLFNILFISSLLFAHHFYMRMPTNFVIIMYSLLTLSFILLGWDVCEVVAALVERGEQERGK